MLRASSEICNFIYHHVLTCVLSFSFFLSLSHNLFLFFLILRSSSVPIGYKVKLDKIKVIRSIIIIMKLNLRITKKYSMYVPTRGLCTHRLCEFELIYVFFVINGAMN